MTHWITTEGSGSLTDAQLRGSNDAMNGPSESNWLHWVLGFSRPSYYSQVMISAECEFASVFCIATRATCHFVGGLEPFNLGTQHPQP